MAGSALFEWKTGRAEQRASVVSLRYWLFVSPGVLGSQARSKVLKLAVPPSERAWWERLWAKPTSPWPGSHAVG